MHRLIRSISVLTILGVAGLCGCQKALFPKDQPRTQFEIYDRMRSGSVQLTEPDEFGNPRPALRARLAQPQ